MPGHGRPNAPSPRRASRANCTGARFRAPPFLLTVTPSVLFPLFQNVYPKRHAHTHGGTDGGSELRVLKEKAYFHISRCFAGNAAHGCPIQPGIKYYMLVGKLSKCKPTATAQTIGTAKSFNTVISVRKGISRLLVGLRLGLSLTVMCSHVCACDVYKRQACTFVCRFSAGISRDDHHRCIDEAR